MCKKVIKNCEITGSDAKVLLEYIDDKTSKAYKQNGGYHTGIDLEANEVYSMCYGVVIAVGSDTSNLYAVTIQYNANMCVRYLHLKSVDVKPGKAIKFGDVVGVADKFVHFEYVTTTKGSSIWSVRTTTSTYYKQDPMVLLDGRLILKCPTIVNEDDE